MEKNVYKSYSSILLEFLTWKMIQNEFEGYVVMMMFLSFNQSPADFAERVWASYGEYILSIWFIIDFGMSSLLCQKPKRMWVVIFERLNNASPKKKCLSGLYFLRRQYVVLLHALVCFEGDQLKKWDWTCNSNSSGPLGS